MFSLIVTTQGDRESEFKRLLNSLLSQTYKDFELIVVDQSVRQSTNAFCNQSGLNLKYIPVGRKLSLSKARNIGLKHASGDIVAFPDDDCWYPEELLNKINTVLSENSGLDYVCCQAYDPILKRPLNSRAAIHKNVPINTRNALCYPISIGIFGKKDNTIQFDEELGAGTKWGSGEESDYILQLLKHKKKILYVPSILVYHPYINETSKNSLDKTYRYGQGYGALIKKAFGRKQYGVITDLTSIFIHSIGGILFFSLKRSELRKTYIARIKGITNGLIHA